MLENDLRSSLLSFGCRATESVRPTGVVVDLCVGHAEKIFLPPFARSKLIGPASGATVRVSASFGSASTRLGYNRHRKNTRFVRLRRASSACRLGRALQSNQ
ncbi:hypothetical protein EVAR_74755_1 [Eumeta japonica]|uniref:Uncharacterized protein n=1 Tax=Eumeta variegata TaxID=151549 RepID=A0A4C1SRV5_EUMVA|nr:hypothetical protein EVAR_74755_1 [Eumeta japonica]